MAVAVSVLLHGLLLAGMALVYSAVSVRRPPAVLTAVVEDEPPAALVDVTLPEPAEVVALKPVAALEVATAAPIEPPPQPTLLAAVESLTPATLASSRRRPAGGDGEIADRVARAGGESGAVQFSLAWENLSDVDLHVLSPSDEHISYRRRRVPSGGFLDVDMNVHAETREAVENVRWKSPAGRAGTYRVVVHLYTDRNRGRATRFRLRAKLGDRVLVRSGIVSGAKPRWTASFRVDREDL